MEITPLIYTACPAKGVNYPKLNQSVFSTLPSNWLLGVYRSIHIAYSLNPKIRAAGASGGVISQTLLFLLENQIVDGAVVLQQGVPEPWLATPTVATSVDEIVAASQSVYSPSPVNTILDVLDRFEGKVAYVGLPDQVASLRMLQEAGHSGACKVEYVIGPYTGTSLYLGAIESFLRSNGIRSLSQIEKLRYREGEWPGYLYIKTVGGEEIRAEKFYYNYLIPFYITQMSLLSVDFTNELTDISVGDAWNPELEAKGEGYSVVIGRSARGDDLLEQMSTQGKIHLEPIGLEESISMHGHMLDFKKRGAFIRNRWRKRFGMAAPEFGYSPKSIPASRFVVEAFISLFFIVCSTRLSRKFVELIPLGIVGPLFETIRKAWKSLSKPTKRKGLLGMEFDVLKGGG